MMGAGFLERMMNTAQADGIESRQAGHEQPLSGLRVLAADDKVAAGLLALCVTFFAVWRPVQAEPTPLQTVPSVDVPRYMGTWYEIAKLPNWFQRKCASSTRAQYSLQADGRVQVANSCRLASGEFDDALGVARQVGAANSPKLKVRFAPAWLSLIPAVWGDYWVVELDDNYQWAAVSEPDRKSVV